MLNVINARSNPVGKLFLRKILSGGLITRLLVGKNEKGLYRHLLRKSYRALRPLIDVCISSVCLLIAMPVIFAAGVIIKLTSRGSAFYTQERVGRNGSTFKIIKLRTMCVDSEAQSGAVWAQKNDSRVTTIGRFLRKTHLDELPQFINVIKGDMSLIGPRPERPIFVAKFKEEIPGYANRLMVKPGITGMAQCYYKYDEDIRDVCRKLRYDMIYVKKMCWLLDVKIILLTFVVSFVWANGRG
ncbi:MAG: sugar transferase [Candidatus Anammoxibacter sp.]